MISFNKAFEQVCKLAADFEKDGYTWIRDISLIEFARPENIACVKESYKNSKIS